MRWLMNMPVSPEKGDEGNFSEEWYAWVAGRHPENTEYHIEEWTKFLQDKIIGEPKTQARSAEVYKSMGWVGIYEEEKSPVVIEKTITIKKDM